MYPSNLDEFSQSPSEVPYICPDLGASTKSMIFSNKIPRGREWVRAPSLDMYPPSQTPKITFLLATVKLDVRFSTTTICIERTWQVRVGNSYGGC